MASKNSFEYVRGRFNEDFVKHFDILVSSFENIVKITSQKVGVDMVEKGSVIKQIFKTLFRTKEQKPEFAYST